MILPLASAWTWSKMPTTGPHVSGHATAVAGRTTFTYGGLTGSAGSPCTDELWKFEGDAWKLVETGEGPCKRMYAAAAMLEDSFCLFGGWDPGAKGSGGTFLDDVWTYDGECWKYVGKMPFPVSRHSACALVDAVLLLTYRGLLKFDGETCQEQTTTGNAPDGLSMCAMMKVGSNILVFGGSTKTQELSNKLYLLDTKTWEWKVVMSVGATPPPMASASGTGIDDSTAVIFGGAVLGDKGYEGGAGLQSVDDTYLVELDKNKATWTKVGKGPEGRLAATLNVLQAGEMLLQGGWDPATRETFDQPWLLRKKP